MYCPSCGSEYTGKLNYCKRCGAELFVPEAPRRAPRLRLAAMFWAIAAFGFLGLAVLLTGYAEFFKMGLRGDQLLIPFVIGLAFVGTLSGMLIWQLSRLVTLQRRQMLTPPAERRTANELPAASPRLILTPTTGPIPSVVEETTRQIAPAYREPQGSAE